MSEPNGIVTIDTGYQRPAFCAAYLVVQDGRAAFIDSGTGRSVSHLLGALDAHGVARDAVDRVILTHVHLDHAGGAGLLMQALPNATLVVHPRGAPHLIDPAKLSASARQVYGDEEFERSYGNLTPVPAERVIAAEDGHVVELAGRRLVCAHTPGHAKHHLSVWDGRSRSWFSGDVFGISYRELDTPRGPFVIPTSSPVQFDPDAMKQSVRRMLAEAPARVYLTHFGAVSDCQRLGTDLIAQIDAMVSLARQAGPEGHARLVDGLQRLYTDRAQRHGIKEAAQRIPALLGTDIELNAQGLAVWLARETALSPNG